MNETDVSNPADLKPGDVVRNKLSLAEYTVIDVLDGHVIAVRSALVDNPLEWEYVRRI